MNFLNALAEFSQDYLLNLLGALAILVVGWLVAWFLSVLVRRTLSRTRLHRKVAEDVTGMDTEDGSRIDRWVANTVFVLLMVFVLIAMFEALMLQSITAPLSQMLQVVLDYAPRIAGALLVVLGAWLLATLLHAGLSKGLGILHLDQRVEQSGVETGGAPLSQTIANTVYWLVFLLFIPAVLGVLQLEGLTGPVEGMVNKILGYLPNIALALLILAIGWFLARLIQNVVTQLLSSAGFDRFAERNRVTEVLGKGHSASSVVGVLVHALILLPVAVAALNALNVPAVTEPARHMLDLILAAIPAVLAAALVLLVAYFGGRLGGTLAERVLGSIGFDRLLPKLGLQTEEVPQTGGRTPSQVVGFLVLVAVMLFGTMEALALLQFGNLAELLQELIAFFGQIIMGLIIIGIGLYLANLTASTVRTSATANADWLARIAQIAIIVLTTAIGLQQMGLADQVINLAFGLALGSVAVAAAVAFGLGGRELASQQLERWMSSGGSGSRKGSSSKGSGS